MNPQKSSLLKQSTEDRYSTYNILRNLQLYFFVGILGSFISLFVMFFPYPVL